MTRIKAQKSRIPPPQDASVDQSRGKDGVAQTQDVSAPLGGDPDGAPADVTVQGQAQAQEEVVGQSQAESSQAAQAATEFAPAQSGVGGAGVMPFQVEAQLRSQSKGSPMNHELPPTEAVSALADQYGVSERMGRPRERILGWAAKIQDGLVGVDKPGELLDQVMGNNLRLQVFYLEGILKMYRKRYPDELKPFHARVKKLEDVMGYYSATMDHSEMAEEKGLPQKFKDHFKHKEVEARQMMLDLLENEGWLPGGEEKNHIPFMQELVDTLDSIPWDDYEADKAFVKDEIGDEIKDLQKAPLNMDELQGDFGLHELRRQLRWIPIYATSLDGLVVHSPKENPVAFYEPLLRSEVANSKYAKLPEPTRETDPIVVPTSLYLANTKYITDVGSLKDRGEAIEAVEHALIEMGEHTSHKKARKEAMEILGLPKDANDQIHEEAHAFYDEMKDNDFFKAMRRSFHPKK
jgi:hypothetical protein